MRDHDDYPTIVIERRSGGLGVFLFGALVGAGAALLYAPRSGEQTRDEIRVGARRLRERAEDTVRDFQRVVTDSFGDVRSEVTGRIDAARDAFEAGREAARESRRDLDQKVEETRARSRAAAETRRPPTDAMGSPGSPPAPAAPAPAPPPAAEAGD